MRNLIEPENTVFKGNIKENSPFSLFYVCSKCGKNIWAHIYNEHIKFCGKERKAIHRTPGKPIIRHVTTGKPLKQRLVEGRIRTRRRNKTKLPK